MKKKYYFLDGFVEGRRFYESPLEFGAFYGGEKRQMTTQKPDENQGFRGRVTRIARDIADCAIFVGAVTLNLTLPISIIRHYQLERGDCFQFYPTEDGRISINCIRPTERAKDITAEVEKWDPSELARLTKDLGISANRGRQRQTGEKQ